MTKTHSNQTRTKQRIFYILSLCVLVVVLLTVQMITTSNMMKTKESGGLRAAFFSANGSPVKEDSTLLSNIFDARIKTIETKLKSIEEQEMAEISFLELTKIKSASIEDKVTSFDAKIKAVDMKLKSFEDDLAKIQSASAENKVAPQVKTDLDEVVVVKADGNKTLHIKDREDPKVLIYITTHMSELHEWYLKYCWPLALQHSKLLNSSDIAVFLTPPENEREKAKQILNETFKDQSLAYHDHPLIEKQAGAIHALTLAATEGWFDGYDWIVRVNPDVIIRNDTFMLDVMMNDPEATGILIDCSNTTGTHLMHTDFFAIKPAALPPGAFQKPNPAGWAEGAFTNEVNQYIVSKGNHRFIESAHPVMRFCRAGHGRHRNESDVLHVHPSPAVQALNRCIVPF